MSSNHSPKPVQGQLGGQLERLWWAVKGPLAAIPNVCPRAEKKSLVGNPDVGSPSAYQIKRAVQSIKALAREFKDDEFQAMVDRAMDREHRTMQRRFAVPATAYGVFLLA